MSAQRLYELDRSSTQFPEQLNELLHDKEWEEQLELLPEGELAELTDYLDGVWLFSTSAISRSPHPQILDGLDPTGSPFRKYLRVLQKVCSSRMILPSTYKVSGELSFTTTQPIAFGGFCDAYKGTLGGGDVCIKRFWVPITGVQASGGSQTGISSSHLRWIAEP